MGYIGGRRAGGRFQGEDTVGSEGVVADSAVLGSASDPVRIDQAGFRREVEGEAHNSVSSLGLTMMTRR